MAWSRGFFVAVVLACSLVASIALADLTEFHIADGLPSESVGPIVIDRKERLWIGTGGGVCVFDGLRFITYTTADGLPSNVIVGLIFDRDDHLWATTPSGVARFDGAHWKAFTTADGLADNSVICLTRDRDGALWFGTNNSGASRLSTDGTWTTFTTADGMLSNHVAAIAADSVESVWFMHGSFIGVSKRNRQNVWQSFTTGNGIIDTEFRGLMVDHSNRVWIGTESGPEFYKDGAWHVPGAFNPGVLITAPTLEDHFGDIWFPFSSGAVRFDGKFWIAEPFGVGGVPASPTAEDANGNLWAGGSGLRRNDGVGPDPANQLFTTNDGLPSNNIKASHESRDGRLWIGEQDGVSVINNALHLPPFFQNYPSGSSGPVSDVAWIIDDPNGFVYCGSATFPEVARFNPGTNTWSQFTQANGLSAFPKWSGLVDHLGRIWVGTNGVSRLTPPATTWETINVPGIPPTPPGAYPTSAFRMVEDHQNRIWIAWDVGSVTRFDPTTGQSSQYLGGVGIRCMLVDESGQVWFGGNSFLTRYDPSSDQFHPISGFSLAPSVILQDRAGRIWVAGSDYNNVDPQGFGRLENEVAVLEGSNSCSNGVVVGRDLWFGTEKGLLKYRIDDCSPNAKVFPEMPLAVSTPVPVFNFLAAYKEQVGLEFSGAVDTQTPSPFSNGRAFRPDLLSKGFHSFRVWARDSHGNVDPFPDSITFEVDNEPPAPHISSPIGAQALKGTALVSGRADDLRLDRWKLEVQPASGGAVTELGSDTTFSVQVQWDTHPWPDGDYFLLLTASDTLGLSGTTTVPVIVDNEPPFAPQTTPATIIGTQGGDVFTTRREAHLYFPPQSFDGEAVVSISPVATPTCSFLPRRIHAGFDVEWTRGLRKTATLEYSYLDSIGAESPRSLAFYRCNGTGWDRVGGTVDTHVGEIAIPVLRSGHYALFADEGGEPGSGSITSLSLTPRVFGPSGTFASSQLAIGFHLAQAGSATVKIYDRSGRLIATVADHQSMNQGDNVVRWDGKGRDGLVQDGLYLVSIEALGQRESRTLAVVR